MRSRQVTAEIRVLDIVDRKGTYAVRRPMEASKRYTYVCYVTNPLDSAERVTLAKPPAAPLDAGLPSGKRGLLFCV